MANKHDVGFHGSLIITESTGYIFIGFEIQYTCQKLIG